MFGMLGSDLSMLQCNKYISRHIWSLHTSARLFTLLSATDVMNHTTNPQMESYSVYLIGQI